MKRSSQGGDSGKSQTKKQRYGGKDQNIEPGWSGIYVTCVRKKERACQNEMADLFSDFSKQLYGTDVVVEENGDDNEKGEEKTAGDDDIAAMIAQEVEGINAAKKQTTSLFTPIDVNCECLLFFRTKKPVNAVDFVYHICRTAAATKERRTRYCNRLTPITKTCAASIDSLKNLAKEILKPHFHQESGQKPLKFAIQVTSRNHNTLKRGDIITSVAECVGNEHGHKVDLKIYDKLIIVECFKGSVGMSVVERDYEELQRFNLDRLASARHDKAETYAGEKTVQEEERKALAGIF